MSIDFHRLIKEVNNNRLIKIDYIDCLPMIVFHRLVLKIDIKELTIAKKSAQNSQNLS